MRLTGLTIAIALFSSLAAGSAATADMKRPAPTLRITKLAPLEVRGTHFRVRERVRLTVVYGELRRSRVIGATRVGAFTASFPTVVLERCSPKLTVTAAGARGSHALTEVVPPSVCPPPPP